VGEIRFSVQLIAMSEELPPRGAEIAPGLRASDADRDGLADELRAHAVAGRIDTEELEERLQGAYEARTTAELALLRRDLPALPPPPQQLALQHRQRRAQLVRRSIQETGGSLGGFGICTVIWVVSGASGFFWPVFLLILVALSAVRSIWDLYGPAADLDAVEAKLESKRSHRSDHDDRHAARQERRAARHERRGD
jgi:Domain of unknown function (DUF1707)